MAVSSETALQISANQRRMSQIQADADRDVARIGASAARRAASDAARAEMWSSVVSTVANAGVAAIDGLYRLKTQTAAIELGKLQLGYQYQIDNAKMTQELLKTQQELQVENQKLAAMKQASDQQRIVFEATQNGNRLAMETQLGAMEVLALSNAASTPNQMAEVSTAFNGLVSGLRTKLSALQKEGKAAAVPESLLSSLTALRTQLDQKNVVPSIAIWGETPIPLSQIAEISARAQSDPGSISVEDHKKLLAGASAGITAAKDGLMSLNSELALVSAGVTSNMSRSQAAALKFTQNQNKAFQALGGDTGRYNSFMTSFYEANTGMNLSEAQAKFDTLVNAAELPKTEVAPGTTAIKPMALVEEQFADERNPFTGEPISEASRAVHRATAEKWVIPNAGLDIDKAFASPNPAVVSRAEAALSEAETSKGMSYVEKNAPSAVWGSVKALAGSVSPAGSPLARSGMRDIAESSLAYKTTFGAPDLFVSTEVQVKLRYPELSQYRMRDGSKMYDAIKAFADAEGLRDGSRSAADIVRLFIQKKTADGTLKRVGSQTGMTFGGGGTAANKQGPTGPAPVESKLPGAPAK